MKITRSPVHLSLRRRILIAVSLVSLIPAAVGLNYFFGYYISFLALLILIFLIILGWTLVIQISSSISKIHSQSRKTLETIGEKPPPVADEMRDLEQIIGLLSAKVKTGFEELKEFGCKTEKLNQEVSKKVLILSTILQANDLYSKNTPAEEVVQFLAYHLKNLLAMKVVCCFLQSYLTDHLKAVASLGVDFETVRILAEGKKEKIFEIKKMIVIDKENNLPKHLKWTDSLGVQNFILFPVISKGVTMGLIVIGTNRQDFVFQKEDKDVLNLFSQNVTLIWEHERVSSKMGELEMFDDLTGLYNKRMVKKRLDEEIKRGVIYQRPCGLISVKINNYKEVQSEFGNIEIEKIVKNVAKNIKANIRPIDVGGRISPDILVAILIEQNKRQSEEICSFLKASLKKTCDQKVELSFFVAESPIDGVSAQEILSLAQSDLK